MQMPLAQRLFRLQSPPAGILHSPAPLQTSEPQAGSVCSAGALVQMPRETWTLQAWQVPLQSVVQQTLSTHLPLRQLPPVVHGSPRHAGQVPPQSMPVSVPFLTPSEQLPQVFAVVLQEGVLPVEQSPLFRHSTQAPLLVQTPSIPSHFMPARIAGCPGAPAAVQASEVQGLLSLAGLLVGSTMSMHTEEGEQTFFMQPPTVAVPQSSSLTQLPVPVLVDVEVVVVRVEVDADDDEPPAERPAVFSVQPPGAASAAPPSASVKVRPIAGDLRTYEKKKLLQEAMGSP